MLENYLSERGTPCLLAKSSPVLYSIGAHAVKIPVCVQELLLPYFGDLKLNEVNIHTDGLPYLVEKLNTLQNGVGAFTFGSDIYFPAGHYDPQTNIGIGTIAHEVYHVWQFSRLGKAGFVKQYIESYVGNIEKQLDDKNLPFPKIPDSLLNPTTDIVGWKAVEFIQWIMKFKEWTKKNVNKVDLDKAYRDISLEVEAYKFGNDFREYLKQTAVGRGEKPDANDRYYLCK
jgi:hypothetical protein